MWRRSGMPAAVSIPIRSGLHCSYLGGADGITAHLREDRRHMTDDDILRLTREIDLPLNLEMAATDEMLEIALHHMPHALHRPEKREERTTEGGMEVAAHKNVWRRSCASLAAGIKVSLFIEPDIEQVDGACSWCTDCRTAYRGVLRCVFDTRDAQFDRIAIAAAHAAVGIECHAGHGLNFDMVAPCGHSDYRRTQYRHFLIGEAIFGGLESASNACDRSWTKRDPPQTVSEVLTDSDRSVHMIIGIGSDQSISVARKTLSVGAVHQSVLPRWNGRKAKAPVAS